MPAMNIDDKAYENPFDDSFYAAPEEDDETVSGSGEEDYTIDFTGVSDKEEFHDRVREGIEVPDYYGNNLDALYDILTEDYTDKVIRIVGLERVAPDMSDYALKFRRLCDDICEEYEEIKFIFEEDDFRM